MKKTNSILLVHPFIKNGGSELRLCELIRIFNARDIEVSVLAFNKKFPQKKLEERYNFDPMYSVVYLSAYNTLLSYLNSSWIRWLSVAAKLRRISGKYDLVISTYNFFPVKTRNLICFIVDLTFNVDVRDYELNKRDLRLSSKFKDFVELVLFCDKVSDKSRGLLINSKFTEKRINELGYTNTTVIYPPLNILENYSFKCTRDNKGIVYLGRISAEKRVLEIIDWYSRNKLYLFGHDLFIMGDIDNSYAEDLFNRFSEYDGINFLGGADMAMKVEVLENCKFAINNREFEAFGVAVAEMLSSGCFVFVPDGGGQKEIITSEYFRFKTIEEITTKIISIDTNIEVFNLRKKEVTQMLVNLKVNSFENQITDIINQIL